MAPDWQNSVEYRWNKSGYIASDALEPLLGSGVPLGGPNRTPKGPQTGATRSAYGPKRLFLAVLDLFGGPLAHPYGPP